MKRVNLFTALSGLLLATGLVAFVACQKNDDTVSPTTSEGTTSTITTVGTGVSDVYKKYTVLPKFMWNEATSLSRQKDGPTTRVRIIKVPSGKVVFTKRTTEPTPNSVSIRTPLAKRI